MVRKKVFPVRPCRYGRWDMGTMDGDAIGDGNGGDGDDNHDDVRICRFHNAN